MNGSLERQGACACDLYRQIIGVPSTGIYLAKDGAARIVLFVGGTKGRQQADIERAKAFHAEYKATKAAARAEAKGKRPRR